MLQRLHKTNRISLLHIAASSWIRNNRI